MKRHLIKNKKIDEVGDQPTAKREPASVSICRLPWKMEKTMEDGEKDEEMKLRGGSIGDEERKITTYLEINESNFRRRRCSVIGRRRRRCSAIGLLLRLSTPSPLQVGFPFGIFLPISICLQSGLGFCFRDQLGFYLFIYLF